MKFHVSSSCWNCFYEPNWTGNFTGKCRYNVWPAGAKVPQPFRVVGGAVTLKQHPDDGGMWEGDQSMCSKWKPKPEHKQ